MDIWPLTHMLTTKLLVWLLSSLVGFEILSTLVLMWTVSRRRQILQRLLAGCPLESLDEVDCEQVLRSVAAEYDGSVYRKIDLVVIAFHLPALASWGIATGRAKTPPIYYYTCTVLFWFGVLVGLIKLLMRVLAA
jgi:hypothetical protein